jgi:hypothetical protein
LTDDSSKPKRALFSPFAKGVLELILKSLESNSKPKRTNRKLPGGRKRGGRKNKTMVGSA